MLVGEVIDQNNILHVLIKIPCHLIGFSDNLLQDNHIIFQHNVDNFKIAHKTWQ